MTGFYPAVPRTFLSGDGSETRPTYVIAEIGISIWSLARPIKIPSFESK